MNKIKLKEFAINYIATGIIKVSKEGIYANGILLQINCNRIYPCVSYCGYTVEVHKLIAYVKYGDSYLMQGIESRHLNGNTKDYSWDNIAIGTHKDNMHDIPKDVWDRIHSTVHADTYKKRGNASRKYWESFTDEQKSSMLSARSIIRESNMDSGQKSQRSKKGWLSKDGKLIGDKISAKLNSRTADEKYKHGRKAHDGLGCKQLSVEEARTVRDLYATGGYNYRDLALIYGTHYNTIKSVIRRTGRYSND